MTGGRMKEMNYGRGNRRRGLHASLFDRGCSEEFSSAKLPYGSVGTHEPEIGRRLFLLKKSCLGIRQGMIGWRDGKDAQACAQPDQRNPGSGSSGSDGSDEWACKSWVGQQEWSGKRIGQKNEAQKRNYQYTRILELGKGELRDGQGTKFIRLERRIKQDMITAAKLQPKLRVTFVTCEKQTATVGARQTYSIITTRTTIPSPLLLLPLPFITSQKVALVFVAYREQSDRQRGRYPITYYSPGSVNNCKGATGPVRGVGGVHSSISSVIPGDITIFQGTLLGGGYPSSRLRQWILWVLTHATISRNHSARRQ
ncbi:hypothetical protein BDZ91DRAFT_763065 [Kalaharituber pfeilii]|nr:hypothetical protein BDZ91DRAFT_763065 [Kalaharituber pfeilii]